MIGALIGDFIGSAYEFAPTKDYNFSLITPTSNITDDSILSLAIADAIMTPNASYAEKLIYWGRKFPRPQGGYGGKFNLWLNEKKHKPYNSYGNGSAMRVSAIAWAFDDLFKAQIEACHSAECSHNHIEGIRGAVSTVTAIWLARHGATKQDIQQRIEQDFGYQLEFDLAERKKHYQFDETCMGTVPEAMRCFLESKDYEDCIRLAVSLGGDADTLACIAGGIAEAFYGQQTIDNSLQQAFLNVLPEELKHILDKFQQRYCSKK